jgi:hypothetical protein
MENNQKELFKLILTEVLEGISEKEFAELIDTFVELYEAKFGAISISDDDSDYEPDPANNNEASEYLKRFGL